MPGRGTTPLLTGKCERADTLIVPARLQNLLPFSVA